MMEKRIFTEENPRKGGRRLNDFKNQQPEARKLL